MGKSRPRSISILANQIREFGSSQSLLDTLRHGHIINLVINSLFSKIRSPIFRIPFSFFFRRYK